MKQLILYKILIVLFFFAACKKIDLQDPVDGVPVFSAELQFDNGTSKSWEAGIDSFYMFTDFAKDEQDVFSFIGKMEREGCSPDCKETLTIIIRDAEQVVQGLPVIDNALAKDRYDYYSPDTMDTIYIYDTTFLYYSIHLMADTTPAGINNNVTYEWSIDGQATFSNEPNTDLTYDIISGQEVTLKVTNLANGDSCVSWQTQVIRKPPQDRCSVIIKPTYIDTVEYMLESLEAIPIDFTGPLTFSWTTGQLIDNEFNFGPFEPFLPHTVTLTDNSTDCQSTAAFFPTFFTGNPPAECTAAFSYDIEEVNIIDSTSFFAPNNDSLQLSAITIIYVDNSGNIYRSDLDKQNTNASFEIMNREEYDVNENGHPTKKLELQFNCTLWDAAGNAQTITDGKAVWGIAYPK